MRYQALELYSGILRAVGWFIIIATVAVASVVVLSVALLGGPLLGSVAVVAAIGLGIVGTVHGLILIATGQFLCVIIDIEANTRLAARADWNAHR